MHVLMHTQSKKKEILKGVYLMEVMLPSVRGSTNEVHGRMCLFQNETLP